MANLKKAAIIGASAASCIYALFLKSKNYDVTIFEGSNNIGFTQLANAVGGTVTLRTCVTATEILNITLVTTG